ncbi:MAG: phosphate acyltransferase PlsX [Planctomycetes bacterium]|nr:phosphate acyltransferase PlsX [Planctomycetota bacterium]
MSNLRIALDVMGGDAAPQAILEGALLATRPGPRRVDASRILLVGPQDRIDAWLREHGGNPGFAIQNATQVIEMGESPAAALRAKPDNSISVSIGAVRKGAAAAALSMGNTGACVGAATLGLGTLDGVRRPGIAVTIALSGKPLTLIDMGANIAPKPQDLLAYGLMGQAYSNACLGTAQPRVGLLNVGEEEGKGTDLCKEAWTLLKQSCPGFVGNVEGCDVFRDRADVIVTDGFTGNVALKLMEEMGGFLLGMVMRELKSHQAQWAGEALTHLKSKVDYAQYGGALLLGLKGVMIIGHGRSDATAVANALWQGAQALDKGVNAAIQRTLAAAPATPAAP